MDLADSAGGGCSPATPMFRTQAGDPIEVVNTADREPLMSGIHTALPVTVQRVVVEVDLSGG